MHRRRSEFRKLHRNRGNAAIEPPIQPVSIPMGLANEMLLDGWSYDPAHGIGEIDTVTRWRNTNRTVPACDNPPAIEHLLKSNAAAKLPELANQMRQFDPNYEILDTLDKGGWVLPVW